jgi:hypothetical protein
MLDTRAEDLLAPETMAQLFVRTLTALDPEERALQLLMLRTVVTAAYEDRLVGDGANEYTRAVALALDRFCFRLWAALRAEAS